MQHTDDLDEARRDGTVEDYVHRVADQSIAAFASAVSDVEATNAGPQVLAGYGRMSLRAFRDPPQRCEKQRFVAGSRIEAMHGRAGSQERTDIGPRRRREPITRHGRSGPGLIADARKPAFQRRVIELLVIAAIEIGETFINAPPKPLQL